MSAAKEDGAACNENVQAAVKLKSTDIVSYVNGRVGNSYPNGYCLKFVEECYQNLGAYRPYNCCAYKSGSSYIVSSRSDNIPEGATVYFGNCGGGPCKSCGAACYGHVGIYVGNGYFVHATGGKVQKTALSGWANKYRGWGYCGNFSIETPNEKPVENDAAPRLHVWMSDSKMGDYVPENYAKGIKMYYLCYELLDANSDKRFDEAGRHNYTMTETIYDSDGNNRNTCDYKNSNNNWIGIVPDKTGRWKGTVKISGDYEGELSVTFSVVEVKLHLYTWFSESKMGSEATSFSKGKTYYLCYKIIDVNSGKTLSNFGNFDTKVTEKIYKPDGSIGNSCSYNNDNNWIGYVPDGDGTYKGTVELSGDFKGTSSTEYTIKHMHSYSGKITKNPTCTTTGIKTYKCACGSSYTETIAKTAHTSVKDAAVSANCTKDGKTEGSHCSVCGQTIKAQQKIAKTGHRNTEKRNVRNATCANEGYSGDVWCKDCNTKVSTGTKTAKTEHTIVKDAAVSATCTKDGKTEGSHCSVCGQTIKKQEIVAAVGHKWNGGKVTTPATTVSAGIKTYTCKVCNSTYTENIPAIVVPETPEDTENSDTENEDDDGENADEENTDEEDADEEDVEEIMVGDVIRDKASNAEYEVIAVGKDSAEVAYIEPIRKKAEKVTIPATVKSEDGTVCKVTAIEDGAFYNNKYVKKITVGNNVKTIGAKAFYGCKNLETISLGKNVTAIKANAFSNCKKLKKIVIPEKVTSIGSNAFYNCKNLTLITIKSKKLKDSKTGKKAFYGLSKKVTVKVPKSKMKTYQKLFRKKGLSKKAKIRAI